MKSYTTLRNLYGSYTQNIESANLTLGDQLINDGHRITLGEKDWWFLQKTSTVSTVASQQFYEIPNDIAKVNIVTVTVSSRVYTPREVTSRRDWDMMNQNSVESDIPTHFFIFNGQVGLYPEPASSSNTITIVGKKAIRDISIADYTTGGVQSVANLGTAVVGTGTTWTASMVGRYLRITESDTALKGDGFWYEIGTYTSATAIGLTKPYKGTAIAAGNAAYTIGMMPMLPEAYHMLPVFYAVWQYYMLQADINMANNFRDSYDKLLDQMRKDTQRSMNPVVDHGDDDYIINPNLTISL